MAAADRFNVNTSLSRNWEHVNAKFTGTGHPDMTRQCVAAVVGARRWARAACLTHPPTPSTHCATTPSPSASEFAAHHHRDTNCTVLGLPDMLLYASTAEGVTTARMRYQLLERMASPVGPPPALSPAALLARKVLQKTAAKGGGGGAGASGGMADR